MTVFEVGCSITITDIKICLQTFSLAIGIALAAAGCSSKPGDSIVGKWASGNDVVFTFTQDGDMIKEERAATEKMGYSIAEGPTLYLKPKNQPMSFAFAISFPSADELVLTPQPVKGIIMPPQDNSPIHLTRVKQ